MRLDQYLVKHHHLTRNRAQQLIATDLILVDSRICNKASFAMRDTSIVSIIHDRRVAWVSRSAEKLAGFLEWLPIALHLLDGTCLDIGSSTGGFTQVLLGLWVRHVDAVDVGTDQLHASLRHDPRVTIYEQTDVRDFSKNNTGNIVYDTIVCDASFISLIEIIDAILVLANETTKIILLYKPQFEVGREHLRKTGVPKDITVVQEKMTEFEGILCAKNTTILERTPAILMGEAGNQEWIYLLQKNPTSK